ncbi:hypothetical protein B0I35DRAFT_447211 [Stachybotrys elegans]|uniref:Uncharacterized protein n=1 Tax=Stachybotrys elegans TaxID=80388 RepID=A0A8K0SGI2_9HYPO|nr:hypothetical protein B0I35DRAFT_447211 [Stachybotrys elegans]
MEKLCAQLPDRNLKKRHSTVLHTFEPTQVDREILECFKVTYGRKIADKGNYTGVREHGPRQLDRGIMASDKDLDTVYIPIAMGIQLSPKVFYQPDRNQELQEPLPWNIGIPIFTVGGSRLHVQEGPVRFIMVEFIKAQSGKEEKEKEKEKTEQV